MIGLMFLGALIAWGLFAFWLGRRIPTWLNFKYPTIAAAVLVPLVFLLPVADEIVAYPQMMRLCEDAGIKMAANMDESNAKNRELIKTFAIKNETLWTGTVKITKRITTYADKITMQPILIYQDIYPAHGLLNIPAGSGSNTMTVVLPACKAKIENWDAAGIPTKFSHLKLKLAKEQP